VNKSFSPIVLLATGSSYDGFVSAPLMDSYRKGIINIFTATNFYGKICSRNAIFVCCTCVLTILQQAAIFWTDVLQCGRDVWYCFGSPHHRMCRYCRTSVGCGQSTGKV